MWEFELIKSINGVYFKLYNNSKKLIVKHGKIFLTDALNEGHDLFVIRVQLKNSITGKKILAELENKDNHNTELVKSAVDSLNKLGINITPELIKRLQDSSISGKLNEQLIIEKQNSKSDSRC